MMTKSDTIAEIMTLNASVDAAFLAGFSKEDLINYLQRLRSLSSPCAFVGARRDFDRTRPSPFSAATAAVL